jgi:D-alanine-D-alanine ligase-like ATP-grasp enzyme
MQELSPGAAGYCPDCGPATVSHAVERWSARADALFGYIEKPPKLILRALQPAIASMRPGRLAPYAARFSAALGLGAIVEKPDEKSNWRARVIWEEAEKRGIIMREFRPFGLPRDIFFATYGDDTRLFDGLPRPRLAHEAAQNWMDDKGIILKKFRAAGIPVPRGQSCTTFAQAEKAFAAVGVPVIVKPSIGSRSRHTYMHITNTVELRHAFEKAKELCPSVVVEEELSGFVFRISLVDGKVAGVMRREPPHVMGDGKSTVQKLVDEENKNPLRHGPIFHTLSVDLDMLASQKLDLESVPAKDRMVILHPKVSRSFGASTTEITDVHPDNHALFLKIAETLDDPLVGVDFIIDDMARSWREQTCGVIECNSLPFIDLHHYPLKGPARNVAGLVWDMIFPTSRRI